MSVQSPLTAAKVALKITLGHDERNTSPFLSCSASNWLRQLFFSVPKPVDPELERAYISELLRSGFFFFFSLGLTRPSQTNSETICTTLKSAIFSLFLLVKNCFPLR